MKKHEYKRLFRRVVGVNPTRPLRRKISCQTLLTEAAFESLEIEPTPQRFVVDSLTHYSMNSHLLPSGRSRTPFSDAISHILRALSVDGVVLGGGDA